MIVIEAVLSKFPLVLSWNKDHIRLGLDKKHYFKTLDELIFLVEQNKENNFANLIVEDEFTEKLNTERSLESIVLDWLSLLEKSNLIIN